MKPYTTEDPGDAWDDEEPRSVLEWDSAISPEFILDINRHVLELMEQSTRISSRVAALEKIIQERTADS